MSTFDVAVVGRGAIGSAAALAFARAGWRVALVGPASATPVSFAPGTPGDLAPVALPSPHTWDQRVYALSPASRALLTDLGVWQLMDTSRLAPVYDMRIFHRAGRRGARARSEVHLEAYQGRIEALAWIVENREVQGALDRAIAVAPGTGNLTRIDAEVDSLTLPLSQDDRGTTAALGLAAGGRLSAQLIVAADGTSSRLRDLAGIDHVSREYEQTAVVANFETDQPHRDCAWQWFGDFGVVALLPLPADDLPHGHDRVSLVWSARLDLAARAMRASDGGNEWLAGEVQAMTESRLGALRLITPPAAYPLRTVRCRQVIKPSFVLIGDAAHAIHPMAGQGMNLGFGDVQGLMSYLMTQQPVPMMTRQPGAAAAALTADWLALRRYERSRSEPVTAMQLALDGLYRAFGDIPAPLLGLRDLGWEMVARSAWLRRRMIAHAVS